MDRLYDLDDICLIPRVISTIKSRDEIKPTVELFPGVTLTTPIIASPMMDVCNGDFALKMRRLGGFGFIHRFQTISEQITEYYRSETEGGCAIGLGNEGLERFDALYKVGCRYFCLDVANGASTSIYDFICELNNKYLPSPLENSYYFIVGNVASKEAVWECSFYPVMGVRVGIAGGGGCTTKNATGVYHPMASLILECRDPDLEQGQQELVIADGGINTPSRFCKSLALGADCVMMGSALAVAKESPSQKVNATKYRFPNNPFGMYEARAEDSAIFRGSASFEVQKEYREPRYIEGKEILLPYKNESLEQIITKYMDGLRSSMSYFNARTLEEYRTNVTYGVTK